MAKKRTLIPFYGKDNQKLESLGQRAMKAGDSKLATAFFDKSTKLYDRRKRAAIGAV